MKLIYLTFLAMVAFSLSNSVAQLTDISTTPSMSGFENDNFPVPAVESPSQLGGELGLSSSPALAQGQPPSQQVYEIGLNNVQQTPITSTAQTTNESLTGVAISNVVKEGDGMQVMIASFETSPVNITGWKLSLSGNYTYTIPGFTLWPGAVVTVHTEMGTNTTTDLYGSNLMSIGAEKVDLVDAEGMKVSEFSIIA